MGGVKFAPGDPLPAEEEAERVVPVIERLRRELPGHVLLSVDTFHASVARAVVEAGADLINDTTGLSDPGMAPVVARTGASLVLTHSVAEPRRPFPRPRYEDVVEEVRRIAPHGVHAVVEVNPPRNAALDAQVLAPHGSVAMYANDEVDEVTLPIRANMVLNGGWQFVLVYTEPAVAKATAVADVSAAVAAGGIRVGGEAGLPLHHYALADVGGAHRAVQEGAVGKVLIDVSSA